MSEQVRQALAELVYSASSLLVMVLGECPSILDDDRGGSYHEQRRLEEALAAAHSVLSQPPEVKEALSGWKLVPAKATPAMIRAWRSASVNASFSDGGYEAMLSAAPTAASAGNKNV